MIDDPQTPGAGPEGTGQEANLGGTSSEWSTVPPAQPASPPAEPQSLEPLPQPPPQAPPQQTANGYQPVYGSQPTPPAGGGYTSGPGGEYPPPPPPGYMGGPGPQYPPPPPPPTAGQGLTSNGTAALSYATFIPAVVFLVMVPYNRDPFIRFHAWQSIAIWVVIAALNLVFRLLGFAGLHLLWWFIHSAILLALFVFWLIALIKASQGQWYKIPIVGDLAASFAGREV